MIELTCGCGHTVRTNQSLPGSPVLCPACGRQIPLPEGEKERVTAERPSGRTDYAEDERPGRTRRFDDGPEERRRARDGEPPKSHALLYTMIALGVCALVGCPVVVLVALLFPAVVKIRGAAARMQSSNNMKQLGLAMHNYLDNTGHFPLAYDLVDSGPGQPKAEGMSWRTALLPYIEQGPLYNQYVPQQPWDSPANRGIQSFEIKTYRDPSDDSMPQTGTVYQVFVTAAGKKTHSVFNHPTDQRNLVKLTDITDGTANTIIIAEAATSVPWYTPRDMPFDPDQPPPPLGNRHNTGSVVGMADGSVRFASPSLSPLTLNALITRDGGEQIVDPNW